MIKFNLICESDHEFEIWFASIDDFDKQSKRGLLSCPACGTAKVEKALMAPRVSTGRKKDHMMQVAAVQTMQKEVTAQIKALREHVEKNSEDVGTKFPEEARKIHYGEAESRGIRGQANLAEAEELVNEGIEILPLPVLPEDRN